MRSLKYSTADTILILFQISVNIVFNVIIKIFTQYVKVIPILFLKDYWILVVLVSVVGASRMFASWVENNYPETIDKDIPKICAITTFVIWIISLISFFFILIGNKSAINISHLVFVMFGLFIIALLSYFASIYAIRSTINGIRVYAVDKRAKQKKESKIVLFIDRMLKRSLILNILIAIDIFFIFILIFGIIQHISLMNLVANFQAYIFSACIMLLSYVGLCAMLIALLAIFCMKRWGVELFIISLVIYSPRFLLDLIMAMSYRNVFLRYDLVVFLLECVFCIIIYKYEVFGRKTQEQKIK